MRENKGESEEKKKKKDQVFVFYLPEVEGQATMFTGQFSIGQYQYHSILGYL